MKSPFIARFCLIFLTFAALTEALSGVAGAQSCGISLDSLSAEAGMPGAEIVLYGSWGEAQGQKVPSINMGGQNRLEVLTWSNDSIRARIPEGLRPGRYRVGVYCADLASAKRVYSSGWRDFEVVSAGRQETGAAEEAEQQDAPPAPPSYRGEPEKFFPLENWLALIVLAFIFAWWIRRPTVTAPHARLRRQERRAAPPRKEGTVTGREEE